MLTRRCPEILAAMIMKVKSGNLTNELRQYMLCALREQRGQCMPDIDEVNSVVVAFRASRELAAAAEAAGALEGLSRSDVARQALIRDLEFKIAPTAVSESAEALS
jgi:hypothetical protein